MSAADYRAIRQINDHLEGMAGRPGANATDDWRLDVLRRRAAARVEAAAVELAGAAQGEDAPPELRRLATAVRSGAVTWQDCVLGRAPKQPRVDRGDDDSDDGELTVFGNF